VLQVCDTCLDMGTQIQGLAWLFHGRTASSVFRFDDFYRANDFNMVLACRQFLRHVGIDVEVNRPWSLQNGSVLYFADHVTVLDGFALPLASPEVFEVKRVIFALSGLGLGWNFIKRNIPVYPMGSYRNLLFRTSGLWPRMVYFATHRWGPFATRRAGVNAMCKSLVDGASVSLLPSGVIGERRWRSGIGAVVSESAPVNRDGHPIYIAPVYLDWSQEKRRVTVNAPGLIRLDSLKNQFDASANREIWTDWLQTHYQQVTWQYDQ
jgi:hypothetical protein